MQRKSYVYLTHYITYLERALQQSSSAGPDIYMHPPPHKLTRLIDGLACIHTVPIGQRLDVIVIYTLPHAVPPSFVFGFREQ